MAEYKRLGDHIREVNVRNRDLKVTNLLGLSMSKQFRPSTSNIVGVDLTKYKVVGRNVFAFDPMSVIRVHKVPIAINDTNDPIIVSPAYYTFEVIDSFQLLPQYLMMWFQRTEFDRYADFKSDAAIRGGYDWDELCNTPIYIPSITRQREIVSEYETLTNRIRLNNQMIQHLEATAQALYRKTFVDSIDKENLPVGWRNGTISEIAEVKNGKAILPNGGNIPVYGGNGIVGYANDSNAEGVVVIGRVGINCGSLYLNQSSCYVNDNAMMAIPKDGNIIFLYRTLMEMDLNSQSEGSGQPLLTQSIIYKQECLIPKQEQCIKFEEQMRIVYKQKYLIEQENEKLTELQSLLLAKMGQ